jgi:hypothetical protein
MRVGEFKVKIGLITQFDVQASNVMRATALVVLLTNMWRIPVLLPDRN